MNSKKMCIPRQLQLQAAMFRLGHVDDEIRAGYEVLMQNHKTVTIFGSARTPQDSQYYQAAHDLAQKLALLGFSVVSGGGDGIMQAANAGAKQAKIDNPSQETGESIAFNIKLPHEQALNNFASQSYEFQHFAPRKIVMTLFADAYVYFPGGFGTLDELMEILTLTQTKKTTPVPIFLYGHDFWDDLDQFIQKKLLTEFATISQGDELLYTITDDVNQIAQTIQENHLCC